MNSSDVVNQTDKDAIITLWSGKEINSEIKTRVCGVRVCVNCNYSHETAFGYPIVRCVKCSLYDCSRDIIKQCTSRILGETVQYYSVCRRVAFELEDVRDTPKTHSYASTNKMPLKKKARQTEPELGFVFEPPKPILKPETMREKPKQIPEKIITKRKGTEGETSYYIRCTPKTRNALVSIVRDDDFQGFIKINEICLQKALRKLPDGQIISMKSDLVDFPEFDSIVERSDLRFQNAQLRKQLKKK